MIEFFMTVAAAAFAVILCVIAIIAVFFLVMGIKEDFHL